MVDEIPVHNGFSVAVIEYGLAENFSRMQCGRGGKSHLDGIEIINDGTVTADIFRLIAIEHFAIAHITVKDIAPVRFIHHN